MITEEQLLENTIRMTVWALQPKHVIRNDLRNDVAAWIAAGNEIEPIPPGLNSRQWLIARTIAAINGANNAT